MVRNSDIACAVQTVVDSRSGSFFQEHGCEKIQDNSEDGVAWEAITVDTSVATNASSGADGLRGLNTGIATPVFNQRIRTCDLKLVPSCEHALGRFEHGLVVPGSQHFKVINQIEF